MERSARSGPLRAKLVAMLIDLARKLDRREEEHIFQTNLGKVYHLPNYDVVIKDHMDLDTIERRCKEQYCSVDEFELDVELMLTNCEKYHGQGTYVGYAHTLRAYAKPLCDEVRGKYEELAAKDEHQEHARVLARLATEKLAQHPLRVRGASRSPTPVAGGSSSVLRERASPPPADGGRKTPTDSTSPPPAGQVASQRKARTPMPVAGGSQGSKSASRAASASPHNPTHASPGDAPDAKRRRLHAEADALKAQDVPLDAPPDEPGWGVLTPRMRSKLRVDESALASLVTSPDDAEIRRGMFVGRDGGYVWSVQSVIEAYIAKVTCSVLLRRDEKDAAVEVLEGVRKQFDASAAGSLMYPAERRLLEAADVWGVGAPAPTPTPPHPWAAVLHVGYLLRFLAYLPTHLARTSTRGTARRALVVVQGLIAFIDANWERFFERR